MTQAATDYDYAVSCVIHIFFPKYRTATFQDGYNHETTFHPRSYVRDESDVQGC
jgi:hypothetical protein